MEFDRRSFLKRAGTLAVGTALGPIVLDSFTPFGSASGALAATSLPLSGPLPLGTPVLVVIELQGGNDSLNTVVPFNDSWYYDNSYGHGSLAISHASALPLAGTPFALHPSLPWLANRWGGVGDVGIVLGTGENVKNEFSHFAATMYRNAGDFSGSEPAGWLGRYNDQVATGSPLASVSTNGLHQSLVGMQTPVLAVDDVNAFNFSVDWHWSYAPKFLQALSGMGLNDATAPGMAGLAATAVNNAFSAVNAVHAAYQPSFNNGVSSGSALDHQLAQAAMLITAGLPSQTYVASTSGYDTHGSQSWTHGDLLSKLNNALSKFFSLIDASNRKSDVFVLITSEFGRQVTANSSGGCDHGQASVNFLIGGGVSGGLYGMMPTLNPGGPTRPNRINDAMIPTVDFRSVYATVLNRLGGDSNLTATVLKGSFPDLGVFSGQPNPVPPVTTTTTAPGTTSTTSTTSPTSSTSSTSSTSTTAPMATTSTTSGDMVTTTTTAPMTTTTIRK